MHSTLPQQKPVQAKQRLHRLPDMPWHWRLQQGMWGDQQWHVYKVLLKFLLNLFLWQMCHFKSSKSAINAFKNCR